MNLHPSWETKPASLRFAIAAQSRASDLARGAVAVLDKLQGIPAAEQLSAVFMAAAILANAAGADAHAMLTRARRIVREAEDEGLRAIGDYASGELK